MRSARPALPKGLRFSAVLLAAWIAVASGGMEARATEIPIALDSAVRMAVGNNLELRARTLDPALSETGIRRARGIYDPTISALVDHRGTDAALSPGSTFTERQRFFDADISADLLLSSGATASAGFTNLWSRNNLDTPLSRFARPQLSVSLSQPILKGFGKEVTEKEITVAGYGKEASFLTWRSDAIATVAAVRDAYFTLAKARENLETRKASLAAARELHSGNRARVRSGVLAEVELLDSDFGVSGREEDLLAAEKEVRDASDALSVLIQFGTGSELVPVGPIPVEPVAVSEDQAIEAAMESHPGLQSARVDLRAREFEARIARNGLLPALSVTGAAGVEGLDREYGSALDELSSADSPFWSVGFAFSYPIGNRAAEADLAASRLRERQTEIRVRSLEESIRLDVRGAFRALETSRLRIDVARKGVDLGEARLSSFAKRARVGLATTKDVLDAESDLTASRERLAAARADYQTSLTRLWRATGELLARHGLAVSDREIESMAWGELR